MTTRMRIVCTAVALGSFFLAPSTEADFTKPIIKVTDSPSCRANCDAVAKQCALDQKVSLATCVGTKDECRSRCDVSFPPK